MLKLSKDISITFFCIAIFGAFVNAQTLTRELNILAGSTVEITNLYGRISAAANTKAVEGNTPTSKLSVTSLRSLAESEIKISVNGSRTTIVIVPSEKAKRVDVAISLPERVNLGATSRDGAIDIGGNFARVEAATDTGTISTQIPTDDITYNFQWTESRPRFVSDFELSEVKEKSGGRFEVKGRAGDAAKGRKGEGEKGIKGDEVSVEPTNSVSLSFTTARGIILVNVPANEVGSDLRERPLTNAAKAIVRSGDSLLMEAIRRSAPKYYGDYARSLPPIKLEPRFANKAVQTQRATGDVKSALVRVTDLKNRAIDGLSASDFEVTEGGAKREVLSVTRSTASFNLVLLLDVSGSIENYVTFIRKAARAFVETVDREDRVSIVVFNDDVKVLSKFTTDKSKLSESLDTFEAGGGTAYYDALAFTVADTLRPLKGERTAIVVLTDGDDNRSFLAFDSLAGSIQESGALIYPLYVPSGLIASAASGNSDIDPLRKKYMSLSAKSEGEGERLASISGGVYYPITRIEQIQKAYEDIVVQLRTAYVVKFRSSTEQTASGASPRLKIKPLRPNLFANIQSVEASQ